MESGHACGGGVLGYLTFARRCAGTASLCARLAARGRQFPSASGSLYRSATRSKNTDRTAADGFIAAQYDARNAMNRVLPAARARAAATAARGGRASRDASAP